MLLTDFHIHSTYSDGKWTIPEIIDLYGRAGFDAIAITDHIAETRTIIGKATLHLNLALTPSIYPLYLEEIRKEKERALCMYNMLVIPGFELTINRFLPFKSAHLVALGIDKYIPADADPLFLAKEIREKGGVVIAAHPWFTDRFEPQTLGLWLRRREMQPYIDAWEAGNGDFLNYRMLKSGLSVIANSDFHRLYQFSSWKTLIDAKKNEADILQAVKQQKLQIVYYQAEHEPVFTEDMETEVCGDILTSV